MSITIRRAGPEDAAPLRDLYAMPKAQAGTLQLPFPSLQQWEQKLEPRDGVYSLLAESDGLVVGNLTLWQEPNPRRRHVASLGMAVRDDWAGRGVGSDLMAAALDLADNWLGLTRLELTVWSDNEAAQALYRKFGFVQEGVARDYGLRHGVLVDTLYMARVRS
ncbi:GNAT family N-acetyltransferase [Aeromonas media]|uniref:GNAT family N-acetyltransferase n=1 Tax=Aeromonas media TaxID=651 RepID=UPI0029D980C0|nr:GNAT family N-acetyltransferase [Aeromonas media]MDX7901250.1 GNAT family N-acetyltransferase [Aeromonas media]